MFVTVQFRNRENEFCGKTYDFELCENTPTPPIGSIIRMVNEEGKPVCNRTRVKVVDVKYAAAHAEPQTIKYQMSSMDEPSIAKKKY